VVAEADKPPFAEFVAAVPFGQALLHTLEREGVHVRRAHSIDSPSGTWLLRSRLPPLFAEQYDVWELSIAVVLSVEGARKLAPRRARPVGPDDLLLLVSEDLGRVRVAGFWGQLADLCFFQNDDGEWQINTRDPASPVLTALADAMRAFDLFDRRDPCVLNWNGEREDLLGSLQDTLLAGQSVGLFGLRKVGKTSLGRTLAEALDPQWSAAPAAKNWSIVRPAPPAQIVVWLDAQGLTERSRDGLAGRLGDLLRARLGVVPVSRRASGWQSPDEEPVSAMQELAGLLDHCLAQRTYVCFVLDEQDLFFVGAADTATVVEVFALLRSQAQHGGLCSVLFIGRDPQWLQAPTMNGVTSPTPGWVRTVWVEPLSRTDTSAIFKHLAARTGLVASEATCDIVYEWTGGHPFLLRQLGSAFWGVAKPGGHEQHVPTEPIHEAALAAFLERDAVIETCREVEHLLASQGSAVSSLFWRLARRPHDAATLWNDNAAPPLRKYGLLRGTRAEPQIARVWTWWSTFVLPTLAKTG
jgi:hypothetical protein